MKVRTTIAAAALAGVALAGGLAAAATDTGAPRRAAEQARDAEKALARHKADKAVRAAEEAVALAPGNAGYRTLLGEAYMMAGRFTSAAQALADALTLDPASGDAALHLALAQIATGAWDSARGTLDSHQAAIAPADRGLALALAGDPVSAVELLTAAARQPGADAKTRQNLALALALAGRWREAKAIASLDVGPAEVDKRIMQWAAFARPRSASDQVAALLGVTPVEDAGQPRQLALDFTTQAVAAVAQTVDPVDAFMPDRGAAQSAESPAPAQVVEAAVPAPAAAPVATPAPSEVAAAPSVSVVFGARHEIVQPLPAVRVRAAAAAKPARPAPGERKASPEPFAPAHGGYYVQLGAYENAAVAREKWGGMVRRNAALATLDPQGMQAKVDGASYYRLSVGGFARADADRLCRSVRRAGGRCFVRESAGETLAAWTRRGGVQLAGR